MKQTGTTKKHAGGHKHHQATHKQASKVAKHNPSQKPEHQKQAHHAVQHHSVKPASPGKTAPSKKPRQLALADGVACCSAEALAASLRLSGWRVTDADVYRLYRATAVDDDAGADIQETLRAARLYGLAGVRLINYRPAKRDSTAIILGLTNPDHAVFSVLEGWWSWGTLFRHGFFPYAEIDEAWEVRWDL